MSHQFSTRIRQHGSLPWDASHMSLGGGYDMARRESLPSPFEEVDPDDSYDSCTDVFPQVDVHTQLFRDERELTDVLRSMTAASISHLSVASVNAIAGYIRESKCNSQNMCLVLRCTLSMPPEHFDRELDLSEEARRTLEDSPDNFLKYYGEYCITGQIRQSSFYAVCSYSSTDTAQLDALAAALGGTGTVNKTSFAAATQLVTSIESHSSSVQETHRFHIAGVEGEGGLAWLENAKIPEAWKGFRAEYKPIPQVALVKHYSSILPGKIGRPVAGYEIPRDIAEALWQCALLQMAARSKATYQGTLILKLDRIEERLSVLTCSNDDADLGEVRDILKTLDNIQAQLRKPTWPAIKAEIDRMPVTPENKWSHSELVWDSCGDDLWEFGISLPRAVEVGIPSADIETHSKTCQLEDTGRCITQKPDPIRLETPGRRIIGAKLMNRYPDPRQGGKWMRVGGWLGGDIFSVKVETRHNRGCHWVLTVWSIPENLLEGDVSV
ncbi:hypothetical protein P171DRAFT_473055 [Karstenula rhodostoma CBS 690.94]|uniref:Uncharacterized protein n=1 Tax=Karstenula rhodostoma CBS 690.94 TaxID=1392251 RepID=A0A9P4PJ88_9PLEO|nr:hypothetical protein P171DRAFT_473055 [Karstenula rhodostoma CBS 690.94]